MPKSTRNTFFIEDFSDIISIEQFVQRTAKKYRFLYFINIIGSGLFLDSVRVVQSYIQNQKYCDHILPFMLAIRLFN